MPQGNVSAIATYLTQSGKRRIFRCRTCATHFAETRETVFFDLRTSEDKVMMALKMLLVRVDLAGIGFVLGVTEETVLAWLRRAASQAEVINRHLLRHLPVTQVQLDEMWNFIERKYARETDEAGESMPDRADGRQWVWGSFAPEFRLLIAAVVGPRTLDTAKAVVAATNARVAGIPAFFSDGFTCYLAALIAAFTLVSVKAISVTAMAADTPAPKEGDWVAKDFKFHTGETMPELKLHYTTIGAPSGAPISYGPSFVPGARGISGAIITPEKQSGGRTRHEVAASRTREPTPARHGLP